MRKKRPHLVGQTVTEEQAMQRVLDLVLGVLRMAGADPVSGDLPYVVAHLSHQLDTFSARHSRQNCFPYPRRFR
jgi:hypothetical protein